MMLRLNAARLVRRAVLPRASASLQWQAAAAFTTPAQPVAAAPTGGQASPSVVIAAGDPQPSNDPRTIEPLPVPAGQRVLRSYTPPPPTPPLTDAQRRALRPTLKAKLVKAWGEWKESVQAKTSHPIRVIKSSYGPDVRYTLNSWRNHFAALTGLLPLPESRPLVEFSADTDLSAFKVLNDNRFGGSSTCCVELRARAETDPETGKSRERYSVVFKGTLRMLMPFQHTATNVGRKVRSDSVQSPILYNQPAPMQDSAAVTPVSPSSLPSRPPGMSVTPPGMASRPPPHMSSTPPGSASATATSTDDGPVNPFEPQSAESAAITINPHPSNPFIDHAGVVPAPAGQQWSATQPPPRQESMRLMPRSISQSLQPDQVPINGFAAVILPPFAYPDMDLRYFDFLSMRVRTDGRSYIFNVRARDGNWSSAEGMVWQARIREEVPRPMHKLEVRMENFLCTEHGRAKSFASPLPRDRIESFGFSITGPPGPFEIELESMAAHTGAPEFEVAERLALLASDAAEKNRRVARRVSELERRQQVQAELTKLRDARAAASEKAAFDAQLLARVNESVDTSAFPREYHEDIAREKAERERKEAQAKAKKQAAAAAQTASSSSRFATAQTPATGLRPSVLEEVRLQVEDEIAAEKKENEVTFGLGDSRSGPSS